MKEEPSPSRSGIGQPLEVALQLGFCCVGPEERRDIRVLQQGRRKVWRKTPPTCVLHCIVSPGTAWGTSCAESN